MHVAGSAAGGGLGDAAVPGARGGAVGGAAGNGQGDAAVPGARGGAAGGGLGDAAGDAPGDAAGDAPAGIRIEHLVTSGTFSLDGGTWDVDNNVWIVGNDTEVVVIDPAHDALAIADAVGARAVTAVLLTHAHDDHIRAVGEFATLVDAPVFLNPADRMLWAEVYPHAAPDHDLNDGDSFEVAGVTLRAIHTPGHSPGSTCFSLPSELTLFSGDTLFNGGPGATGRSHSDFGTIIASIRDRLLTLPPETVVLTGHGASTTIAAEAPHLQDWIARGH